MVSRALFVGLGLRGAVFIYCFIVWALQNPRETKEELQYMNRHNLHFLTADGGKKS